MEQNQPEATDPEVIKELMSNPNFMKLISHSSLEQWIGCDPEISSSVAIAYIFSTPAVTKKHTRALKPCRRYARRFPKESVLHLLRSMSKYTSAWSVVEKRNIMYFATNALRVAFSKESTKAIDSRPNEVQEGVVIVATLEFSRKKGFARFTLEKENATRS